MGPPLPPYGEQIEITHGDQRAVVIGVGGGLRSYSAAGRDVLDGRRHQLPPTEPERHNAIHGLARRELSCLEPGRSFTSSWGITSEGAGQ